MTAGTVGDRGAGLASRGVLPLAHCGGTVHGRGVRARPGVVRHLGRAPGAEVAGRRAAHDDTAVPGLPRDAGGAPPREGGVGGAAPATGRGVSPAAPSPGEPRRCAAISAGPGAWGSPPAI